MRQFTSIFSTLFRSVSRFFFFVHSITPLCADVLCVHLTLNKQQCDNEKITQIEEKYKHTHTYTQEINIIPFGSQTECVHSPWFAFNFEFRMKCLFIVMHVCPINRFGQFWNCNFSKFYNILPGVLFTWVHIQTHPMTSLRPPPRRNRFKIDDRNLYSAFYL